jgi:hypothetical protein
MPRYAKICQADNDFRLSARLAVNMTFTTLPKIHSIRKEHYVVGERSWLLLQNDHR